MGLKKEFARMHLLELHFLNFVEPPSPHALNRNSTDVDEPPTYIHTYEEVCNDPEPLIRTINKAIEKIRKRSDVNADAIKYFMVRDPKFARFYLLPKIHRWLHDVPGRPVISNCGYYTESISSFLDFHKPLAWEVKSYMKDTNDFLKKLRSLPNLPDDIKKRKRKKETL